VNRPYTPRPPLFSTWEERPAFVVSGCRVENNTTVGITLCAAPIYQVYREYFEPIEDEV
jgi:hypothetical protein